jgi:hypothetical protein
MSKRTMAAMIMGVALLIGGGAKACVKMNPGVRVYKNADGSGGGGGSFAGARTSANANSQIYCYSYATYAFCTLYNGLGDGYVACSTQDANMMAVIRSLNSDAYVGISVDTAGNCTSVTAGNESAYAPKAL